MRWRVKLEVRTTIKKCKDTGEYIVRLHVNGVYHAAANYYTPDKEDAVSTAREMVRQATGISN